VSLFYINKR